MLTCQPVPTPGLKPLPETRAACRELLSLDWSGAECRINFTFFRLFQRQLLTLGYSNHSNREAI